MAEATPESQLKTQFVKVTEYAASDIAAVNTQRRTVVTKNGGKYVVNNRGTSVRHVLGPELPGKEDEEEQ